MTEEDRDTVLAIILKNQQIIMTALAQLLRSNEATGKDRNPGVGVLIDAAKNTLGLFTKIQR